MDPEEIFLLGKWLKEIGNVPSVEQKSPNFHSNHLQTDQFTAKSVGQKREPKDFKDRFQKAPQKRGFLVFNIIKDY